ncbi:hypothetical protein W97_03521 [Coniosporium apollinis CBS 100218]|uniref:Protein transport protein SEC9 n=1 Tax=Coniosporium apollinis (strain CBS 100218) TaxID=1168221 RepID=R7YQU0_CONA1|nr:uncharacterized protein W97_03521 [Coniosporium apollinis CBS 100218]EON64290.1 hypothetical protein W97_03521 [Coniosporium apollinis CBS 100218]
MKKFGFSKKGSEATDDDTSTRNALFGSRSKSKDTKAAPASSNPYAQPQAGPDPYAQKAPQDYRQTSSPAPPPYNSNNGGMDPYRRDKSPVPPGGYSAGGTSQAAYGQNRYGSPASAASATARPGGYGGFARADSQDTMSTDAGRQELFGGAQQRVQQREDQGGSTYGAGGEGQGYGGYGDRQLTAEEEEEEDVQATKQQIKFIKQQDVASTRNALRLAEEAEASGRDTLSRLGAQGERIHNTELNLDKAANQNRIAEEKARELKHLNRSMWAMHVGNPFTKASRKEARDQGIMDTHRREREQRDATRAAAYASSSRQQETGKDLREGPGAAPPSKASLAERAKYQFEADSDDDEMENEIDSNLDQLHGAAKRLNNLGRAMGTEIDAQNKTIARVTEKTDRVDDQIVMNRARLDRIH